MAAAQAASCGTTASKGPCGGMPPPASIRKRYLQERGKPSVKRSRCSMQAPLPAATTMQPTVPGARRALQACRPGSGTVPSRQAALRRLPDALQQAASGAVGALHTASATEHRRRQCGRNSRVTASHTRLLVAAQRRDLVRRSVQMHRNLENAERGKREWWVSVQAARCGRLEGSRCVEHLCATLKRSPTAITSQTSPASSIAAARGYCTQRNSRCPNQKRNTRARQGLPPPGFRRRLCKRVLPPLPLAQPFARVLWLPLLHRSLALQRMGKQPSCSRLQRIGNAAYRSRACALRCSLRRSHPVCCTAAIKLHLLPKCRRRCEPPGPAIPLASTS